MRIDTLLEKAPRLTTTTKTLRYERHNLELYSVRYIKKIVYNEHCLGQNTNQIHYINLAKYTN